MEVNLNKWHRCNIDKQKLKKLCKKSDKAGFKHVIIFFLGLFLIGILAYITWGTWWSLLFFLIYGNIMHAVIHYGMKLDIGLLSNQNSGIMFFIKFHVL